MHLSTVLFFLQIGHTVSQNVNVTLNIKLQGNLSSDSDGFFLASETEPGLSDSEADSNEGAYSWTPRSKYGVICGLVGTHRKCGSYGHGPHLHIYPVFERQ